MLQELLVITVGDATLLANTVHARCNVFFMKLFYVRPRIAGEFELLVTGLANKSGCHVSHHNVHLQVALRAADVITILTFSLGIFTCRQLMKEVVFFSL